MKKFCFSLTLFLGCVILSFAQPSLTRTEDLCRYYIIFSPNNFSIANDGVSAENCPAQLDLESFQKWLGRVKKQDKDMVVTQRDVVLRKK